MSLMARLLATNFPFVMLLTQYRMHPDISAAPTKFIYGDRLINSPSTFDRKIAKDFAGLMQYNFHFGFTRSQVYFIDTGHATNEMFKTIDGHSVVNMVGVAMIYELVNFFLESNRFAQNQT